MSILSAIGHEVLVLCGFRECEADRRVRLNQERMANPPLKKIFRKRNGATETQFHLYFYEWHGSAYISGSSLVVVKETTRSGETERIEKFRQPSKATWHYWRWHDWLEEKEFEELPLHAGDAG